MNFSRRDLLKLAGGSAVGIIFTPVPWKLLDDSAIWTQNWPWIPTPARGDNTSVFAHCTACPIGCGIALRCVAGHPVAITPVRSHPGTHGFICPAGLTAHHLPWHPDRALRPLLRDRSTRRTVPVSFDDAVAAVRSRLSASPADGLVAVLDQQPGRAVSAFYRAALGAAPAGRYVVPASVSLSPENAVTRMVAGGEATFGLDLRNTRSLLSFGAPVFEGWIHQPEAMAGVRNGTLSVIQIEPGRSRSAQHATEWLPIRPGSEPVLALGIAHVLLAEGKVDRRLLAAATDFAPSGKFSYTDLVREFSPEKVSSLTGAPAQRIRDIARFAAEHGPTVAIGGGDPGAGPLSGEEETVIQGLNFLLGSVGRTGGFVARPTSTLQRRSEEKMLAEPVGLDALPPHSVRLLILDSADGGENIPWALIERALVPGGSVVASLAPGRTGLASHADVLIPGPTSFESIQESAGAPGSLPRRLGLSPRLSAAPEGITDPVVAFSALLVAAGMPAPVSATTEDLVKARIAEVYADARGAVHVPGTPGAVPLSTFGSTDAFQSAMLAGAYWEDEHPTPAPPARFSLLGANARHG
jgi:hypothetical protein